MAWNGTDDEYSVVWPDGRNPLSLRRLDIYGQRVSAAGVRLGEEFRISSPDAAADEIGPAVAWNGLVNQYLVLWADHRSPRPAPRTAPGGGFRGTCPGSERRGTRRRVTG